MSEFETTGLHLNMLASEAAATALLAHARIAVSTDTPLLAKACEQLGIEYDVLAL